MFIERTHCLFFSFHLHLFFHVLTNKEGIIFIKVLCFWWRHKYLLLLLPPPFLYKRQHLSHCSVSCSLIAVSPGDLGIPVCNLSFLFSFLFFFDIVIVFCHANVAKFSESSTDLCSIPDSKGLEATREWITLYERHFIRVQVCLEDKCRSGIANAFAKLVRVEIPLRGLDSCACPPATC